MADSTYEEATRCPQCGTPGEVRVKRPISGSGLPVGTMLHTIYCVSELCLWYNTPWIVQVNADGSVPPPKDHSLDKKEYVGFEGHNEEAERIIASLRSTQELSMRPDKHGEIRG